MTPTAQTPAPPFAGAAQRRLRNYLLDARFQLKFASYFVGVSLLVAAILGAFLWKTTATLFAEMADAVEARSAAAQTSKELGNATLNNDLMQHMNDPAFEKQLTEKSQAIDAAYEAEKNAIIAAREQLVKRQQVTLFVLIGGFVGFICFIGFAAIVATHRIVGPLHRVKRMTLDIAAGRLTLPAHGLRPSDELKDVFEAFYVMVTKLREREEDDLKRVAAALEIAERTKVSDDLVRELQTLQARLRAKLE